MSGVKSILSVALANYRSQYADDLARYESVWARATDADMAKRAFKNSPETRAHVLDRLRKHVAHCEEAAVWLAGASKGSTQHYAIHKDTVKVEDQFRIGFLNFDQALTVLNSIKCQHCSGSGECNDAEPGDISFRTWKCEPCKGTGVKL